ncbi:uncharacterized protein LOC144435786 [Glandiceps talaboti]
MASNAKRKRVVQEILTIVAILISILALIAQGVILDYYIISNNKDNNAQYAWIVCDIVATIVWLYALITSFLHFRKLPITEADGSITSKPKQNVGTLKSVLGDELRFIYVCWLAYACCLVPRVAYIFKTIAEPLTEAEKFGPNTLKMTISVSAILFLFLVFTHHDVEPNTTRQHYIAFLTGSVTFDLLDTCQLLDMLFVTETGILLTWEIENAIISFACINLFLPVLALVELRENSKDGKTTSRWFKFIYSVCHIFLTNLPYFVIRSHLWHGRNSGVSTYLTKNVIMIVLDVHEFFCNLGSFRLKVCKFCKNYYFLDKFLHNHNVCTACDTFSHKVAHDEDNEEGNDIPLRDLKDKQKDEITLDDKDKKKIDDKEVTPHQL